VATFTLCRLIRCGSLGSRRSSELRCRSGYRGRRQLRLQDQMVGPRTLSAIRRPLPGPNPRAAKGTHGCRMSSTFTGQRSASPGATCLPRAGRAQSLRSAHAPGPPSRRIQGGRGAVRASWAPEASAAFSGWSGMPSVAAAMLGITNPIEADSARGFRLPDRLYSLHQAVARLMEGER
jgi:hypothetical protein